MNTSSKILIALSGILFIVTGCLCLSSAGGTLLSIAWLIGVMTLAAGISSLCFYFSTGRYFVNGNYILLNSIADIVMGILFLGHKLVVAAALPYMFAMWIFVAGLQSALHSFDFKKAGFSTWWVMLVLGIVAVGFSVCSFFEPVVSAVAISILAGGALISRGLNRFVFLAGANRLEKILSE